MPLIANSLKNLSAALITAALIIAAIVLGRDILVPLALAGISCFVLVPIVRCLRNKCVPNGVAQGIVLFAVFAILSAASYGLSSQLLSLAADLPAYRTNVLEKVRSIVGTSVPSGLVGRAIDAVESYQEMLNRELRLGSEQASPTQPPPDQPTDPKPENKVQIIKEQGDSSTWYGLRILAEPLAQAALTFLFVLFLLMQYKDLRDKVVRVFGVDNMTETTAAMSDAGDRLTALFTGQALLNASFGFVVTCVLLILGVPNAPLWGVVAFVMRFVPFVGSYIAAVPPVLLAAAVDPGWTKALCTAALFAIGEPIMGQVLEPLVLGRRAGLSPFAMVLSTSFWTLAWGPIGLVLAAPITLVLVVLGKYIPDLEFLTVLLGDEPPLSQQQDLYHRFLSGDVYAAMSQIEELGDESSPEAVLDAVVFPALKLAARDRKRGRLDSEIHGRAGKHDRGRNRAVLRFENATRSGSSVRSDTGPIRRTRSAVCSRCGQSQPSPVGANVRGIWSYGFVASWRRRGCSASGTDDRRRPTGKSHSNNDRKSPQAVSEWPDRCVGSRQRPRQFFCSDGSRRCRGDVRSNLGFPWRSKVKLRKPDPSPTARRCGDERI